MTVEKCFSEKFSLRLTESNLLNASEDEYFSKFDDRFDQIDRDFDEYETESEKAGPVVQLIARYAF